MRVYAWSSRGGPGAVLFAIAALGLGVVLFLVGFALLAVAAVVGGVLAAGVGLYRMLRGGPEAMPRGERRDAALDPALEVFPERRAIEDASADDERAP